MYTIISLVLGFVLALIIVAILVYSRILSALAGQGPLAKLIALVLFVLALFLSFLFSFAFVDKFLAQYEKNMLSCKYVEERKKMILEADSVDFVSDSDFSRSVVQGIRAVHPTDDFYMQNEPNNMLKLLRANRTSFGFSEHLELFW